MTEIEHKAAVTPDRASRKLANNVGKAWVAAARIAKYAILSGY